jgi:Chaperone of endosialidase
MSFLDNLAAPFGTSAQQNAANAQITGINNAIQQATPQYEAGLGAIQGNYAAGIAPFTQAYGQAQPGISALQGALGLSGPIGTSAALQQLQSTPGYQFTKQQGDASLNALAQQQGYGQSGNALTALSNYNQGLAQTTANNYIGQLSQFPQMALGAAQGAGNLYAGQGNQTNAAYQNIGNMLYGANTSIGNANANAALAPLTAGANILGLGTGLLGGLAGSSGAQSALSNIGKGIGSGISGLGSTLFGLSDRRAKDDVEEIGKLNDGQKVYRFRYKGDSRPQIGLMAQEVEKRHPDAVAEIDGVKFVHYGKATNRAAELQAFMS